MVSTYTAGNAKKVQSPLEKVRILSVRHTGVMALRDFVLLHA